VNHIFLAIACSLQLGIAGAISAQDSGRPIVLQWRNFEPGHHSIAQDSSACDTRSRTQTSGLAGAAFAAEFRKCLGVFDWRRRAC
jgi:hypothetical protein